MKDARRALLGVWAARLPTSGRATQGYSGRRRHTTTQDGKVSPCALGSPQSTAQICHDYHVRSKYSAAHFELQIAKQTQVGTSDSQPSTPVGAGKYARGTSNSRDQRTPAARENVNRFRDSATLPTDDNSEACHQAARGTRSRHHTGQLHHQAR